MAEVCYWNVSILCIDRNNTDEFTLNTQLFKFQITLFMFEMLFFLLVFSGYEI